MRLPRVRFTVRRMMAVVAVIALLLSVVAWDYRCSIAFHRPRELECLREAAVLADAARKAVAQGDTVKAGWFDEAARLSRCEAEMHRRSQSVVLLRNILQGTVRADVDY